MFGLFRKKEAESEKKKEKKKGPFYVYKPMENTISFRAEFREDIGYVYPGWSKSCIYIIEGDSIRSAADGGQKYIIAGRDVLDAETRKALFRVSGGAVYALPSQRQLYELRESIRVQGTL